MRHRTRISIALVVVTIFVVSVTVLNRPSMPEGPVPIVWDVEVCAQCKMHVGDPRFAAQLQVDDGTVLNFDDPGCAIEYLEAHPAELHAFYFREYSGEGWVSRSDAVFFRVDESPMGYRIGVSNEETRKSHGWDWAQSQALSHGGMGHSP